MNNNNNDYSSSTFINKQNKQTNLHLSRPRQPHRPHNIWCGTINPSYKYPTKAKREGEERQVVRRLPAAALELCVAPRCMHRTLTKVDMVTLLSSSRPLPLPECMEGIPSKPHSSCHCTPIPAAPALAPGTTPMFPSGSALPPPSLSNPSSSTLHPPSCPHGSTPPGLDPVRASIMSANRMARPRHAGRSRTGVCASG